MNSQDSNGSDCMTLSRSQQAYPKSYKQRIYQKGSPVIHLAREPPILQADESIENPMLSTEIYYLQDKKAG